MEEMKPSPGHRLVVDMETDKGTMHFELLPDRAPKTVANFVRLIRQNFYDGLTFHRIIRDQIVQGGCPRGDGSGGPGYNLAAEFNDLPHEKGVLSFARGEDPDSGGSQFFIVHGAHTSHLDGAYTGFGRLIEGLDILDEIAQVPVDWNGTERSRPQAPVKITMMSVREEEPRDADDGEGPGEEEPKDSSEDEAEAAS